MYEGIVIGKKLQYTIDVKIPTGTKRTKTNAGLIQAVQLDKNRNQCLVILMLQLEELIFLCSSLKCVSNVKTINS